MKALSISLLFLAAIASAREPSESVFRGEISDTQCAMNVHSLSRSHQEMIEKQSLGTDAASCAKACVRRGGEWVLRSGEHVFRLKNQEGMEVFAGQQVEIKGTLNPKNKTIENLSVEAASATKH